MKKEERGECDVGIKHGRDTWQTCHRMKTAVGIEQAKKLKAEYRFEHKWAFFILFLLYALIIDWILFPHMLSWYFYTEGYHQPIFPFQSNVSCKSLQHRHPFPFLGGLFWMNKIYLICAGFHRCWCHSCWASQVLTSDIFHTGDFINGHQLV